MAARVGRLAIEPLIDGTLFGDPVNLFGTAPDVDLDRHADLLTDEGRLEMAIGGFLVRGQDRTMIIDTGYGPDHPECGHLLRDLRQAGVDPTDVTDVVLTHLHKDHVGGVTAGEAELFPNATYRCHVADWDHFVKGEAPDHASPTPEKLAVVQGRLEPWDSDCSLVPGLDVVEAPGHTPGSCIVVLSSPERRMMILGDVVHCAIQLAEADWSTFFDVDPVLALQNSPQNPPRTRRGDGARRRSFSGPQIRPRPRRSGPTSFRPFPAGSTQGEEALSPKLTSGGRPTGSTRPPTSPAGLPHRRSRTWCGEESH